MLKRGGRRSVASMDGNDVSESVDRPLIAQPHGGAILRGYAPGVSGNPAGRPTDAERVMRRMVRMFPDAPEKAARALYEAVSNSEHKHWLGAFREYLDRTEGPVKTALELSQAPSDRTVVVAGSTSTPPQLPSGGDAPQVGEGSNDVSDDDVET